MSALTLGAGENVHNSHLMSIQRNALKYGSQLRHILESLKET